MTKEEAIEQLKLNNPFMAGKDKELFSQAIDKGIEALENQKIGHWVADEVQLPDRIVLNYHCSVCGRKLVGYSTETLKDAPYCHCGAKMEGENNE